MTRENPRSDSWARYYANHPNVLATCGEANGREPNCSCVLCDPNELLPRPNILSEAETHAG